MYVCMYVCICMYMYVYACICMYMHVYVCICMYMYVYVCICMYVYLPVCICMYMYAYVCLCMFYCFYVYFYVCLLNCVGNPISCVNYSGKRRPAGLSWGARRAGSAMSCGPQLWLFLRGGLVCPYVHPPRGPGPGVLF